MNFTEVIMAHIAWKKRLLNYMSGDRSEALNPENIEKDNQCVLGKWIYGEGSQYQSLKEFARVKDEHANFHRMAANVVRFCDAGKMTDAEDLLHGEYSRTSERVKRELARLAVHMSDKR